MNRHWSMHLTLAALLPLLPVTGARAAVERHGATLSGGATVGAQFSDVGGSEEKFEEYRDVSDGFVLDHVQLRLDSTTSPNFVEIGVRNGTRDDESYRLTLGRHGKVRASVFYDATPHNFSRGKFLWSGFGTGRLVIPNSLQAQLEGLEQTAVERSGTTPATLSVPVNTDRTGEDAARLAIVGDEIERANAVRFRVKRHTVGASLEYDLTNNAAVWVRVANEDRSGARVLTTGTYERWNVGTGLTHTLDQFVVSGQDLAEPVEHRTLSVAAGTGFHGRTWLADVEYTFTNFQNSFSRLLWDNPFRITDAPGTGGLDRGRYAVGQLALPPESQSHEITASAAVDLPLHGRLAASLGYGMITQDEPFVPYTLNSAVLATNAGNVPAPTLALPQRDLNGEVRTVNGNLQASVRPIDIVGVTAKYGVYWYDGKSDEVTFPGYAAFGESLWRTVKNDTNEPVRNEVFDFVKHNADLGFDIRIARPLTVSVEGGWEYINFTKLRLDSLTEFSVGGSVSYRPIRMAHLSASYRYADREMSDYRAGRQPGNPEATGLVNFNWADRKRHEADVRLRLTPSRMISFGASVKGIDEDYGGDDFRAPLPTGPGGRPVNRVVDVFRFGRSHVESLVGAVDVTVTPVDRLALHAYYARDYRQEQMKSAAKDDNVKATPFFGFPDDYSPVNFWNSDIYERGHTVGLGATVGLIPERLIADLGYNLSWNELEFVNANPNGVQATTLQNAVAQGWKPVRNRLHEIVGDLGYRVTPRIRAGVRYLFEWYDLTDFAWDLTNPIVQGTTAENATRFLFADATYDGYVAHVGRVYVTGTF